MSFWWEASESYLVPEGAQVNQEEWDQFIDDVGRVHVRSAKHLLMRGSFEFASPEMAPIFDAFNQWAFANRSDVIEGACADIDGTSDPAACAAAVLGAANEYVADPNT